jgi:hypothetical protein
MDEMEKAAAVFRSVLKSETSPVAGRQQEAAWR